MPVTLHVRSHIFSSTFLNRINDTFLGSCINLSSVLLIKRGTRWRTWFEALRYKPAGHGFDSRWGHSNFSFT
jgi:hypothetical protein